MDKFHEYFVTAVLLTIAGIMVAGVVAWIELIF